MQPSTEMMSYQNPPIIKKDGTAVPLGMTITPPMMTTAGQRSKRIIAIVAAAGMMLVVGVVLMQDSGSAYHHLSGSGSIASTAEGLVVAPPKKCGSCYGAGTNVTLCCNTCDDVQQVGDPILYSLRLFWPSI